MFPRLLLPLFLVAALTTACHSEDDAALAATSRRVFGRIPAATNAANAGLVALGRHLYFSTALSKNGTQSCNSCHPVSRAGADGEPTSRGAFGTRGRRNTPSVFNAAHHLAQFWDGRAATLEEQAAGPITNPVEMAMPDARAVAERLRTAPGIDRALFRAAFPGDADPFTLTNAARAIAAFERTLRTSDRFDRFQNGDLRALTRHEKEGLRTFLDTGCASCHNGPLLGANRFMKIGLMHAYENTSDYGRSEVTNAPGDDYVFKVPSLRNVQSTAPYFHDGRIGTLPQAVERMAWHQLGRKIEPHQRDAIVAFLGALSDAGAHD